MTDTKELRRLAQAATPGPWEATTVVTSIGACHKVGPFPGKTTEHPPRHACLYVDYESADNPADREIYANASFIAAANPAAVLEILDRLEAAEKERETDEERIADLMADLNRVGHENDALRAKIEQMERQEPAGWLDESDLRELGYGNSVWLNPDDQGRMVPVYLAAAPEAKP